MSYAGLIGGALQGYAGSQGGGSSGSSGGGYGSDQGGGGIGSGAAGRNADQNALAQPNYNTTPISVSVAPLNFGDLALSPTNLANPTNGGTGLGALNPPMNALGSYAPDGVGGASLPTLYGPPTAPGGALMTVPGSTGIVGSSHLWLYLLGGGALALFLLKRGRRH